MKFRLDEKPINVGPCGEPGGSERSTNVDIAVGVDRITIRHAGAMDSMEFRVVYNNGRTEWSSKTGGERTEKELGSEERPIKVGPWGGPGGSKWSTNFDGAIGVDRIIIRHAGAVDSMVYRVVYNNGRTEWSSKTGGKGGERTDKVNFDRPDEILTSVEGYCGRFRDGGPVVVRALKFITNKALYGPFGCEKGTPFSLPVSGGKIIGFHGRAGGYIDAIGVYLKQL